MKLVEFVPPVKHPLWKLCLQMGITEVVVKVNPTLTGLPDPWRFETLSKIVGGLKEAGLTVVSLEGDPFDMTPIKQFGEEGIGKREEALAHYCELLESMGRLGIKLLCYNFMVGPGWSRTGVRSVRGGALATCFNIDSYRRSFQHSQFKHSNILVLDKPQVWSNYEHFLRSVMSDGWSGGNEPVMALHPLDPASGESIHCYSPHGLTHFRILNPKAEGPCPPWPPKGWTNGVEWLEKNYVKAWHPAIDDGTFLFVGECGAHQGTVPHATFLAWLEDLLTVCDRRGWGWALWNLDGAFGILDTPRTDITPVDFHGHKLDRQALEVLLRHKAK